jgi:hypothetical protein
LQGEEVGLEQFPGYFLLLCSIPGYMLTSPQTRLQVFSTHGADASNEAILDKAISVNSTVRSIVISQDGNNLALGLDRKVYLYNLRDTPRQVETLGLSDVLEQSIKSQRLNFSLDGSKIAVATRDGGGNIEACLWDHESKVGWSNLTTARRGRRVSDFRLKFNPRMCQTYLTDQR